MGDRAAHRRLRLSKVVTVTAKGKAAGVHGLAGVHGVARGGKRQARPAGAEKMKGLPTTWTV